MKALLKNKMKRRKSTHLKDDPSNSKKFRPKNRLKKFDKNERRIKWQHVSDFTDQDDLIEE